MITPGSGTERILRGIGASLCAMGVLLNEWTLRILLGHPNTPQPSTRLIILAFNLVSVCVGLYVLRHRSSLPSSAGLIFREIVSAPLSFVETTSQNTTSSHSEYQRMDVLWVVIILGLSFALRYIFFNHYLIGGDPGNRLFEASRIYDGRLQEFRAAATRPSLYSVLIGLCFLLAGAKQWIIAKYVALFFSVLIPPASYLLAREMTLERRIPVFVGIWMSFSPLLLEDSYMMAYQGQYTFFSLVSLFALIRFVRDNRHVNLAFAVAFALLAWSTYSMGMALVLIVLLAGLWVFGRRCWPYCLAALLVKWGMGFQFFPSSYTPTFHLDIGYSFLYRLVLYLSMLLHYPVNFVHFDKPSMESVSQLLTWILVVLPMFLIPILISFRRNLIASGYFGLYLTPFLFFGATNPAYIIPILPILATLWLHGIKLSLFTIRSSSYRGLSFAALSMMVFSALASYPLYKESQNPEYLTSRIDYYYLRLDEAIHWIDDNIPKGSRIFFTNSLDYYRFFLGDTYRTDSDKGPEELRIHAALEKGDPGPYFEGLLNSGEYLVIHSGDSPFPFDPLKDRYIPLFLKKALSGGFSDTHMIEEVHEGPPGLDEYSHARTYILKVRPRFLASRIEPELPQEKRSTLSRYWADIKILVPLLYKFITDMAEPVRQAAGKLLQHGTPHSP